MGGSDRERYRSVAIKFPFSVAVAFVKHWERLASIRAISSVLYSTRQI